MKTLKNIRFKYYLLLALAAISIAAPFLSYLNQQAAAKAVSDMSSTEQVQSYAYFQAVSLCIEKSRLNTSINSSSSLPQWFKGGFNDPDIVVGYLVQAQTGQSKCGNLITSALSLWGYTNNNDFLRDLGYTLSSDGSTWNFKSSVSDLQKSFESVINKKIYGGNSASIDDTARLKMITETYINKNGCAAKDLGVYNQNSTEPIPTMARNNTIDSNNNIGYTVVTIFDNLIPTQHIYSIDNNKSGNPYYYAAPHGTGNGTNVISGNCSVGATASAGNMGIAISALTNKIYSQLLTSQIASAQTKFMAIKAQYKAGCKSSGIPELTCNGVEAQWNTDVTTCVKSNFSQTGTAYDSALASCMANSTGISVQTFLDAVAGLGDAKQASTSVAAAAGAPPVTTTPPTTSCAVDGVGWIVCPVMTFIGGLNDAAYGFISGTFLNINVGLLSTTLPNGAGENPTYTTWGTFRNIANILFVIAFLFIVFSQLTSFGVSNYGVKKMLPRLIIAAVLVNTSYFIVQLSVDVSNILGYSLKSLFENLPVYSTAKTSGLEIVGEALTWTAIIGGVAAAGVAIGLAVTVPVLLAALVAVLMTVVILIARQALIVLLVIISPIAFVAWLLPNTEQWFKKWWKMFSGLLMVFPVVGVLFGASKLAATVIEAIGAGTDHIVMQILAMGVATVPLIMLPSLLKGSLNAAGSIGGKLSGLSTKANSRVAGKVKAESRLGEAMKNRQVSSLKRRAERRSRSDGWQSRLDNSSIGRSLGFSAGAARASQITEAADQEEMKNAHSMLGSIRIPTGVPGESPRALSQSEKLQLALGNNIADANGRVLVNAQDKHIRRAAIEQVGAVGTVDEISTLINNSGSMDIATRKTLAAILPQSSAAKKASWLGGRTIADVEAGTANTVQSIKRTIASGGITAESLISGDANAARALADFAASPDATVDERNILRNAESDIRSNPAYIGRVTSGSDIANELARLR